MNPIKIVLFANTEWYLYNFRLALAQRLRQDGHDVLLLSPPGPYGARLRALGFRWQPVPMNRRSLNPLAELRLVFHLAWLFRREKPDIVHGLTIKPAVYGSIAARLARIQGRVSAVNGLGYVFTSRDRLARYLRPIVRLLMQLAFGGETARLVVQNPDDRRMFESANIISRDHIRLIPGSGVNCSLFLPGLRQRGPGEPLRVLCAARLLRDKGICEFVEAAHILRDRDIRFCVAGDPDPGNPAAIPPDLIAEWQNGGVVELLGHVEDMPALFARIDVVVLPSYREGLPKVLIEAAACGLPLVTTDVPGCREVVSDGVDGLLVPMRDAKSLAHAIARLDDDPQLRQSLGLAAHSKAVRDFDETIIVRRTLDVYAEILRA